MNNLFTLVKYELKKLFSRKITWISLAVMLILSFLDLLSTGISAGRSDVFKNFNGLEWNEENFSTITSMIDERGAYERGNAGKYRYITQLDWYYNSYNNDELCYEDWLSLRHKRVNENYEYLMLSEKEIAYWNEKGKDTDTLELKYAGSWINALICMYRSTMLFIIVTSLILSPCFSEEYINRTDALTLCTRTGRKNLFAAKYLSAAVFTILSGFIYSAFIIIVCTLINGPGGFSAPVQEFLHDSMMPLKLGTAALLIMLLMIVSGIMHSALLLMISLITRNSIAPAAVGFASVLLPSIFDVQSGSRTFTQIMSYLPTIRCGYMSLTDERLFFGMNVITAGFIIYITAAALITCISYFIYRKYRIKSR